MQIRHRLQRLNSYQYAAIFALSAFILLVQAQPANAFMLGMKPQNFQKALGVALSREDHAAHDIAHETDAKTATPPAKVASDNRQPAATKASHVSLISDIMDDFALLRAEDVHANQF